MFASHVSAEPAACIVLEALGKKPLITANMHLGEGTGAVASLPLWDMALAVLFDAFGALFIPHLHGGDIVTRQREL